MRNVSLWRALLGVDKRTVIEDVELGDGGNEHAGGGGGHRACAAA